MLNTSLTLGCFGVAALSGYQYIRLRRTIPVTAMHLGISALFFTALGLIRTYNALFDSSSYHQNLFSKRTFVQE